MGRYLRVCRLYLHKCKSEAETPGLCRAKLKKCLAAAAEENDLAD